MYEELIDQMRKHAASVNMHASFAPPLLDDLLASERSLGFALPSLLKQCYLELGNGGFGPGYGVIGVTDGNASDYGNLVETYRQLSGDFALEGKEWPRLMVPICDWGCNIFSCVECVENQYKVCTFEEFELWPQDYDLEQFFLLWMRGVDILSFDESEITETKIRNPFTGKKDTISRRRRS